VTAELQQEIDDYLAQPGPSWGEALEVELDEMRQAQLRALGYVLTATEQQNKKKARDKAAAERRAAREAEPTE
jgi:hypothetical protein